MNEINFEMQDVGKIDLSMDVGVKKIFPPIENLEVTPTKEQQVFNHENSYGYDNVTVNPIPDEYIIPDGTLEIASNGDVDVTTFKTARVGVYTSPTLQDKSITITENGIQNVTYDEDYDGLNSVKIITDVPSGDSKYAPRAISFYRYTGTELDEELANLDTSKLTSTQGLFYYCSKLTTLDLSGLDLSNVTTMYQMFSGCSALVSVNFGEPGSLKVTNTSEMFSYCSKLLSVDLSNFDMSNVTNASSMFTNCSALKSVNLNNVNTSKVTNMSKMFYYCSELSSIDFSDLDTSSVTSMSQMFHSCRALKSVNISNFDGSKLTNTTQMFNSCSSLTTLIIDNPNVFPMTNNSMLTFTGIANGEGYVYVPDNLVQTYKTAANWSTYADRIKGMSEYTG